MSFLSSNSPVCVQLANSVVILFKCKCPLDGSGLPSKGTNQSKCANQYSNHALPSPLFLLTCCCRRCRRRRLLVYLSRASRESPTFRLPAASRPAQQVRLESICALDVGARDGGAQSFRNGFARVAVTSVGDGDETNSDNSARAARQVVAGAELINCAHLWPTQHFQQRQNGI